MGRLVPLLQQELLALPKGKAMVCTFCSLRIAFRKLLSVEEEAEGRFEYVSPWPSRTLLIAVVTSSSIVTPGVLRLTSPVRISYSHG